MNVLIKFIIGVIIFVFIIKVLLALLIPIGIALLGYGIFKLIQNKKKKKAATALQTAKAQQKIEQKQTLEYKMTNLLKLAKYDVKDSSKRLKYQQKDELNLLDMWYKFIDLRAKLHLNNTFTSREEAVLHLMCDEILYRLENAEVEITENVRKEFIVENLKPLMTDVLNILEGISPVDSISIDAYQLLQASKEQHEKEKELVELLR